MTLSDLSIKNPVFAWMLMFALITFGWIGYGRMGVSQMPDVDFPIVNVAVTWEGAAPEIMEAEVVDIIEDAVTSVQGVREITSSSKQGQASITVELEPIAGSPTKRAFSAFVKAFEDGYLIRTTGDIIALSPPLIVSKDQIAELIDALRKVLRSID